VLLRQALTLLKGLAHTGHTAGHVGESTHGTTSQAHTPSVIVSHLKKCVIGSCH
jgi:hypothetical protein